jgi:hypothetical protein
MTITSPPAQATSNHPPEKAAKRAKPRPPVASRRFGYALAIAINVVLIYLINEWPGWQSLTFVTPDAETLIPIVNASLVISTVVNAIYLIADPRWLRASGEAVTGAVSFIVILCVLTVFPFDFSQFSFDWTMLLRVLMVVGLVGSMVSVVTNLVTLIREVGKT